MPQKFGRFWLHEKIGHGGMAEIFRASVGPDPDHFELEVVIKRLHRHLAADRAQVDMFLTEADVTRFLDHPNLISAYEANEVDGIPYIAMTYVWGIDLERLMDLLRTRRARFPADLAVYVIMQVLRGLDYVHRAKAPGGEPMEIIHRDITPSNIFITFSGEVKIADFGVARVKFLESRDEARFIKGKPAYVPPEVLAGEEVSQRDDLWGAALCLYEMLTGRPVDEGYDPAALAQGDEKLELPPIRQVSPDIDKELDRVLRFALHPNPARRPQDAYEFYRLLKRYMMTQGISVDGEALGQFVRSATGLSSGISLPKVEHPEAVFDRSGYRSPVGPSLTQRILVSNRRRRRWVWPAVAAGLALVGVVVTVLALR